MRRQFLKLLSALLSVCLLISYTEGTGISADHGSNTDPAITIEREDITPDERIAFMESLQNNKISPNLIRNLYEYDKTNETDARFTALDSNLSQEMQTGMPTTGTAKVLVLTVEFNDMKFDQNMSVDLLEKNFFGEADEVSPNYPYESLSAFYKRSSYGKLDIQGDALTGCSLPNNRSYYDDNYTKLVTDTITYYDSTGVDFSEYDGNNDGVIDNIYFHFAGPSTEWGSTWWSYCSYEFLRSSFYVIDGAALGTVVMLHQTDPIIPIHETGHVLGLPDYYDYEDAGILFGGNGGSLTNDMMNNNSGDHNGFSKLLFGWIDDVRIVSGGEESISLRPLGEYGDVAIVFPEHDSMFSEYYLIEYTGSGNYDINRNISDNKVTDEGLRIFHVSAQLNDSNTAFLYDNTGAGVKLIEAVNRDHGSELSSSLFLPGQSLTPDTIPSSGGYDYSFDAFGTTEIRTVYSGVSVDDITIDEESCDFTAKILGKPSDPELTFEIDAENQPIANNVMDIVLKASGVFYDNGARPYIVIDDRNVDLKLYTTTFSRGKNRAKLMHWTDNEQDMLRPDTQYKIVIPQDSFIGENGALNDECEFYITTDGFLQTESSVKTSAGWASNIFVRDDGKLISPVIDTSNKEYKLIVDDINTFVSSEIELPVPDDEEITDGLIYDDNGIIKLYDGNFAWVRNVGRESDNNVYHITKFDLYGSILSDFTFSDRMGLFIPFEDGVLLYYRYDFDVVSNCVYIELSGTPAMYDIDTSVLSYSSKLGPSSFAVYPVDKHNFMIVENIKNYSESKAYIIDKAGNVKDSFVHGDIWNKTKYIKPFRLGVNDHVIFKPFSDVYDDYNNEHQRNILIASYKNGKLSSERKLFEGDRDIYSYDVNKTDFGYEVKVRYKIRNLKYGFSDVYPVIYFYNHDFDLIASFSAKTNDNDVLPVVIYKDDQDPMIVCMQEFERDYKAVVVFDVNDIDKPMPYFEIPVASDDFAINEENNIISGIVPGITTVGDIINSISVPDGVAIKVIRTATGIEAENEGAIKSYHVLKVTSADGRYSEYYSFDMPESVCSFNDIDLLNAILAVDLPMVNYDIDNDRQIAEEEMMLIRNLPLADNNISDLTGLEQARSLEYLYLRNNQISDSSKLNVLAGLKNLVLLELSNNQISDICVLDGMTNLRSLQYLFLNNNQISDISVLSNFTRLHTLGLSDNQISDISALSDLNKLEFLFLMNNQITDISPLTDLTLINELWLSGNQITDISVLNSMDSLVSLDISSNILDLSTGSPQKAVLDGLIARGVTVYDSGQQQITELRIDSLPFKLTYEQGESLDASGLVVTGIYSNGYEIDVTDYEITGYDPNVSGNQILTVSYQGRTDTFSVVVSAASYTVTFNTQGGSSVTGRMADHGSAITAPQVPSRSGYTFLGWYKESAGTNEWNFASDKVTSNITLYAKWRANAPENITSGTYTVNNSKLYVSKIKYETTVSAFISKIDEATHVRAYRGTDEITGSALIGTGLLFKIMDGDTVKKTYTAVVTGDINGDGKVTLTDFVQLKAHILGKSTLAGAFASAADLNGDGKITLTDFVKAKAHLLGKELIIPQEY